MSVDLNEKQKRFCDEYLKDYNATQAATRAGYSPKTAYSQGHDLLKKPEVQSYLAARAERITKKLEISQERTMQEIARIAFSDLRCLFNEDGSLKNIADLTEEEAAILGSVDVDELFEMQENASGRKEKVQTGFTKKVKLWDKTKALEMLAKHFKIYSDSPVNTNTIKFGYGPEVPV